MRRAFAFLLILAVLLQPGAPQARAALQVLQRGRPGVAHARTQPAHQLVDHVVQRAFVRHDALDSFGHEFAILALRAAVAILAQPLHRAEAAHAAILLETATFVQHDLAG